MFLNCITIGKIIEQCNLLIKHYIARQRTDPVLAPNHLSVARPLRPEDLDRCVT